MNLATFERAQVAAFAYQQARYTGSLDSMKAVCYILRNRVKAGWGDGSWLSVLNLASGVAGNNPDPERNVGVSGFMGSSDRLLQLIVRDVDDIYLGQDRSDDSTRLVCSGDNPPKTGALYYTFVDRDQSVWFIEHIIRKPEDHPQIGSVGPVMLFK